MTAKSEEAAQAITQMLEGILAFVSLPNEEQPNLAELAKKIKINCEEKTVKVKFEVAERAHSQSHTRPTDKIA